MTPASPAAPGTAGGAQEASQQPPRRGIGPNGPWLRPEELVGALHDRGGAQEAVTPVEALAAEWERLAAEHRQKAEEYDRDHEMECFHRGCAAGLTVAAEKIREQRDALAAENERLRAENAKLSSTCQLLSRIVDGQARGLYAARIDVLRGDYAAARETLLVNTEDILELHTWNGTETGTEWYERTREDGEHA